MNKGQTRRHNGRYIGKNCHGQRDAQRSCPQRPTFAHTQRASAHSPNVRNSRQFFINKITGEKFEVVLSPAAWDLEPPQREALARTILIIRQM